MKRAVMADLFDNPAAQKALRSWWKSLDDHRGVRAHLRRARSLNDILAEPRTPDDRAVQWSIRNLHRHVGGIHFQKIAAVAGVLSHVRSDVPGDQDLGRYFASGGDEGDRGLSEPRFERLLRLEDIAVLYPQLVRVLRQFGNRAPVVALARGVYGWSDRTRRDWACGYYGALFESELVVLPVDKEPSFGPVAKAWWEALQDHPGERSGLEHCDDLHAVQLERGFHRLRWYAAAVGKDESKNRQQLAAVAAVFAHVRYAIPDDALGARPAWRHDITLAELAASDADRAAALRTGKTPEDETDKKKKKTEFNARLRENRFRRLLATEDRRDLVRPLIRAVIQLGREADVARLANDIFFWNKKKRGHWADDYYRLAQPE